MQATAEHACVQFHRLAQATRSGCADASGRIGRNFAPERQQETSSLFGALAIILRQSGNGPGVMPAIPKARVSG